VAPTEASTFLSLMRVGHADVFVVSFRSPRDVCQRPPLVGEVCMMGRGVAGRRTRAESGGHAGMFSTWLGRPPYTIRAALPKCWSAAAIRSKAMRAGVHSRPHRRDDSMLERRARRSATAAARSGLGRCPAPSSRTLAPYFPAGVGWVHWASPHLVWIVEHALRYSLILRSPTGAPGTRGLAGSGGVTAIQWTLRALLSVARRMDMRCGVCVDRVNGMGGHLRSRPALAFWALFVREAGWGGGADERWRWCRPSTCRDPAVRQTSGETPGTRPAPPSWCARSLLRVCCRPGLRADSPATRWRGCERINGGSIRQGTSARSNLLSARRALSSAGRILSRGPSSTGVRSPDVATRRGCPHCRDPDHRVVCAPLPGGGVVFFLFFILVFPKKKKKK